ncbi:glycosyltransferase [Megamonas funiformis]|uniref:glycosyltransferase n=1 Tax=Megamonas funiformis TaxID=437897 RepID=UPI00195E3E8D|nr:glycosyltransferase [Megamonas funiformis]MBM6726925.1 glycosyltransferase [Megamonas funiformis]
MCDKKGKIMKILHVGEYASGGVATYLNTLLNGFKDYNDIENYLLISEYKSEKKWNITNSNVIYYKYKRSVFNIFSAIKQIHDVIKRIEPDIIHVHSSWAGLFVRLPYLIKRKKCKIIYTAHGWSFIMDVSKKKKFLYAIVERILSIITDKIINISKFEEKEALSYGLNKKKMVIIYNGVKDKNYNIKYSTDESNNKIKLLFVGRLDKTKGIDILLDIYDKYRFENLHLYIIGESVLDNIKIKSDDNITYLGWIDNKDIDKYYQMCDIVVMPSRWDGFGLVAVEAMRNSKPVIVSNRGALPELVKNGINGYIFKLDEENSLKNILLNLDKNFLKKMGMRGRNIYLENFTDKIFVKNIYNLYKNI